MGVQFMFLCLVMRLFLGNLFDLWHLCIWKSGLIEVSKCVFSQSWRKVVFNLKANQVLRVDEMLVKAHNLLAFLKGIDQDVDS